MESLGSRVRLAREGKKESQGVFAKKCGISQGTLSAIESNTNQPKAEILQRIAHHIGKSIDWIVVGGSLERETDIGFPSLRLPLFLSPAPAGTPTPAGDEVELIDLGALLVPNPSESFLVRVVGDSMKNAGIAYGDHLIVDRSTPPKVGDVVVAVVEGETTIKRLEIIDSRVFLYPENEAYEPIDITDREHTIQGVAGLCIRGLTRYRALGNLASHTG